MSDSDDFFSGGSPSAKFPTVGTVLDGTITRVGEKMQQRDFTTSEPKTYSDGQPMWQLPIDVQTAERDPQIEGDDGVRTLYVKGQMKKAMVKALRAAGQAGPRVGGRIRVTYVGDDQPPGGRGIASKRYEVKYAAPAPKPADDFFAGGAPATQPPAAPPASAPFDRTPTPVGANGSAPVSEEPPW